MSQCVDPFRKIREKPIISSEVSNKLLTQKNLPKSFCQNVNNVQLVFKDVTNFE